MSDLVKIAVDAMGGDGSPKKVIDGIILNHKINANNYFKIYPNKEAYDKFLKNNWHKENLKYLG